MIDNKLVLTVDDVKESYVVLFKVESEDFTYLAFKENKTSDEVYFGKVKETGKVIKNVTKKEEKDLMLVLSKYTKTSGDVNE